MPGKTDSAHKLGQLISALRVERGLSISALAARAGVGKATISRWESGQFVPVVSVLEPVLDALAAPEHVREDAYACIDAPRGLRALRGMNRLDGGADALGSTQGGLIKALRLRAGLPGRKVAELMGVSTATISHWERGERRIDTEQCHRLLDVLRASPRDQAVVLRAASGHGYDGEPNRDHLLVRLARLKQRLGDLDWDGLELELILTQAEAMRLARRDPWGLSIVRACLGRRALLHAESGRVGPALRLAYEAMDILVEWPEPTAFVYPPVAIEVWAHAQSAPSQLSRSRISGLMATYKHIPPGYARKEVLLQSFGLPAAVGDRAALEELRHLALLEHEKVCPEIEPIDIGWLYGEALDHLGQSEKALTHLPSYGLTTISQIHVETARAISLLKLGDPSEAFQTAEHVRYVADAIGYLGPVERRLLDMVGQKLAA